MQVDDGVNVSVLRAEQQVITQNGSSAPSSWPSDESNKNWFWLHSASTARAASIQPEIYFVIDRDGDRFVVSLERQLFSFQLSAEN